MVVFICYGKYWHWFWFCTCTVQWKVWFFFFDADDQLLIDTKIQPSLINNFNNNQAVYPVVFIVLWSIYNCLILSDNGDISIFIDVDHLIWSANIILESFYFQVVTQKKIKILRFYQEHTTEPRLNPKIKRKTIAKKWNRLWWTSNKNSSMIRCWIQAYE